MAVYDIASVIGIEFEHKYDHLLNKHVSISVATYKKQKTQKVGYFSYEMRNTLF